MSHHLHDIVQRNPSIQSVRLIPAVVATRALVLATGQWGSAGATTDYKSPTIGRWFSCIAAITSHRKTRRRHKLVIRQHTWVRQDIGLTQLTETLALLGLVTRVKVVHAMLELSIGGE